MEKPPGFSFYHSGKPGKCKEIPVVSFDEISVHSFLHAAVDKNCNII